MPKRRISGTKRKSSQPAVASLIKKKLPKNPSPLISGHATTGFWRSLQLESVRVLGVSLGGGKTEKSSLAFVDYFPSEGKIFLSQLVDKISAEPGVSPDFKINYLVSSSDKPIQLAAFDVPSQLPKCVRCELRCPGFEICREPEIDWMRSQYEKVNKKKRPQRLMTPYTERCAEVYVATEINEEPFHPHHTLGSNLAPLTARALFLRRRLGLKTIEVLPRLSLWRIGLSLGISKSYLRSHKHSFGGEEARRHILDKLIERNIAFIYVQDKKTMIENGQAFESFICAITAVLKYGNQCEGKPSSFPKGEEWIEIPKSKINWK